jgi:hypothetical protein
MKVNRPEVTPEDFAKVMEDFAALVPVIRREAGPGAFVHPHEILGCALDQMGKLREAVTASSYSGDSAAVRLRCLEFPYGLLFGAASLDVLDRPE